ncbi:UdgX family uracil-DNA binding protein [Lysobacter silvisoli]|uniref:Type-4 uracil-DNA glycosylase n=1 Tax=Lysobacter silvisoli TaxID=2293254 RepID=A0A371K3W2_9GAMM|nr:UdgX family uracil-DNA binding protein [Lysobacter silvisoli]RDZ28568.1 uracil-DNA glycosylase [Lysobacter silvisoli]
MAAGTPPRTPPFAKPVTAPVPQGGLRALRAQAADCRACPLWRHATATVFGEGPARAQAMLIGEQPGDEEDLAARPFVGPAGRLLDRALAEAGLDRRRLYLTNTVKHFKFRQRGKRRLHNRANAQEQEACRVWLAAEWLRLRPRLTVALGAMAAQTLFGAGFRLSRERGRWIELDTRSRALATWHPSAVLRTPPPERDRRYRELVQDLSLLAETLQATTGGAGGR